MTDRVFTDKPGYAFGDGPPAAVTGHLARKVDRESWNFREVEPEEHAVAFTVAKSAGFDILADVREELERALAEGATFEDFRKRLKPRLVEKGWWGRAVVEGPDGAEEVQLGSTRRLRTIYRANLRSARAAGQWERIQRSKAALPYLEYRLGPSERHRPHHESKAGWILPADHAFWDLWFPPNGWGCKCWVRQVGRAEAERRGITREVNIPTRRVVNPETGAVRELPAGLDPAWAGNPGKTRMRNAEAHLEGKLEALARGDDEARRAMLRVAARDIAGSWRVARIHAGEAPGSAPVGVVSPATAAAMGATTSVVRYGNRTTPQKMRRKRADVGTEILAVVAEAFDGEVGVRVFPDGLSRVAFVEFAGALWKIVIKRPATRVDELWVSTWHRAEPRHVEAERRAWLKRSATEGETSPGS